MPRVLVHGRGVGDVEPCILDAMFHLRCRVFKERLGWDVAALDRQERDRFDQLDPVYVIVVDGQSVIGSVRLLSTTGPYMLRDVFADFLGTAPAPCASDVWESSRFVTDPEFGTDRRSVGLVTSYLLAGMWELALAVRVKEFVSAFYVTVGRLLRLAGCQFVEFGVRRKIGGGLMAAGSFPVNEDVLMQIRKRGGLVSSVLSSPPLSRQGPEEQMQSA